jgi:hypothetical protein
VLVIIGEPRDLARAATGWADLDTVTGEWARPRTGRRQATLTAVLIRPDGYIAWAAAGDGPPQEPCSASSARRAATRIPPRREP